jgi:cytoskeletal protein RodZ
LRELGAYLRWKRKEKGKSLEQVSSETRLRVEVLRAVENGDIQLLPAPVYARGMVKIYLEYLDSLELLPQYEEFLKAGPVQPLPLETIGKPAVTRGFRRRDNRWIVVLLALAVLVAGYLLWQQKGTLGRVIDRKAEQATVEAKMKENEANQVVPAAPVSSSLAVSPAGNLPASEDKGESDDLSWLPGHGGKAETPAGTTAALKQLEITASQTCWVLVTRGKDTLFRGTLKKGETRVFSSAEEIQVRYGRPSAVSVRWLGKDLGRPSSGQKVVTVVYKADGSVSVR